jgi:hypothetical protein
MPIKASRSGGGWMNIRKIARKTPLIALGGALATIMATALPAQAANSGWWYNPTHGARAYFSDAGDRLTVCDVKTDSYEAVVWLESSGGAYAGRVYDTFNNGKCTSAAFYLYADNTYKIQVCLANNATSAAHCESGWHPFYVT